MRPSWEKITSEGQAMKKTELMLLAALFAWITCGPAMAGPVVMYGGLGGHAAGGGSTNDGALVTVDQATAATTLVGHPAGVARLTGIAFDADGSLFGSTLGAIPYPPPPSPSTSKLILINPDTGALISTIGPIVDGPNGPAISIDDLAMQPGTDVLFGIRSEIDGLGGAGKLYAINKASGVATLVGNTGHVFGSIAFAPTGTLYLSAADLGAMGPTNASLKILNPVSAAVVSSGCPGARTRAWHTCGAPQTTPAGRRRADCHSDGTPAPCPLSLSLIHI